jgi:hypothetical protein
MYSEGIPIRGSMSGMTTAVEFQWSDLARRSPDVGEALDDAGEVVVTRGSRRYRIALPDQDVEAVLRDLCRLLSAVVATGRPSDVQMILNAAWPWTRALPDDDQLALAAEVGPLAETCESLATWRPLLDSLAAWRGTARAWASGTAPKTAFRGTTLEVTRP